MLGGQLAVTCLSVSEILVHENMSKLLQCDSSKTTTIKCIFRCLTIKFWELTLTTSMYENPVVESQKLPTELKTKKRHPHKTSYFNAYYHILTLWLHTIMHYIKWDMTPTLKRLLLQLVFRSLSNTNLEVQHSALVVPVVVSLPTVCWHSLWHCWQQSKWLTPVSCASEIHHCWSDWQYQFAPNFL